MSLPGYATAYISLCNDRISREDGERQQFAAGEILRHFVRQPGVILADEVGMGKTFVAMAVATCTLLEKSDQGPVVVMCPPSLKSKWPNDWKVFREKCLAPSLQRRFRATSADSGVEFLRLLDDPPQRRSDIIFLTHGALHRSIGDGFIKLAVIKRAFKGRSSLVSQRQSFQRFAGKLLWLDWAERRSPGILGRLLDRPYDTWLRVLHRADPRFQDISDDPVPKHLTDVLEAMSGNELEDVVEGLRNLPVRESANLDDRLKQARQGIADAMEQVWKTALQRARFRSPLLILDEAHHVKNPGTRLASLFATEESLKDSEFFQTAGALGGKFDRMLFLTATPFQLGHAELIRVLERFEGIGWDGTCAPSLTRAEFKAEIKNLGTVLDNAQAAALRLDAAWGRLDRNELLGDAGEQLSPDTWWAGIKERTDDSLAAQVFRQVVQTKQAIAAAEGSLSPWVLRYLKSANLPDSSIPRRTVETGSAIRDGGNPYVGLEIGNDALLPFLLAGRAQALLAATTKGRALFAEGLASSFEAYLDTRSCPDVQDEDDLDNSTEPHSTVELDWYLSHLDRALPRDDLTVKSLHPKVRATAERAVELWCAGEKVLIFCHYRATGRALRQHVSALLSEEIIRIAQRKLPNRSPVEVRQAIDEIGDKFFRDEALRSVVTDWARKIVERFEQFSSDQADRVIDVVRRFIRTPSFVVRYLPLDDSDIAGAFKASVGTAGDGQVSLASNVEHFCHFLADRCIDTERAEFLAALDTIQTGTHFGKEVRSVFDSAEGIDESGTVLLPNVRLANGQVKPETRRRLLLAFNTPLFPEILIASSVMAEGVDLHLNCRYVIHHDLCWNPSTLEQRSGRVDRIGSKAERLKKSIHLYMPYIAATQDEKMFRVVRDRERWFQIIMGEKYSADEASTDKQAERIPLPSGVQQELTMSYGPPIRA